jgi:hypothetical protein
MHKHDYNWLNDFHHPLLVNIRSYDTALLVVFWLIVNWLTFGISTGFP